MVEEKISDSKTRMQADAALLKKDVSNLNAADVNEAFDLFEGQRLSIEALDDFENSVNELIGCKLERTVELLGEEYDLSDTTTQRQIVKDVNAAEHFLQPIEISNRQGMQHWMELSAVSEDTINSCNQAIDDILNEAEELAEIQTAPDRTRRIQLYARVANWLTDNAQVLGEQCPVCGQNIEGRIDSVTGEEVQSHIQECCMANSEAWSKAPQHWAKEQIGKLNTSIPAVLRRETVGNPRMQLGEAMVKEVSNSSCFQGALHALAAKLSENWAEIHENYTDKLPELTLQTPEILLENCSELWDLIKRIKSLSENRCSLMDDVSEGEMK